MANQTLSMLLQEEMKMGLKGGLYHQTQIKLAYHSNRIEGSRLSEERTRYIFETNTLYVEPDETANVDDIMERIVVSNYCGRGIASRGRACGVRNCNATH